MKNKKQMMKKRKKLSPKFPKNLKIALVVLVILGIGALALALIAPFELKRPETKAQGEWLDVKAGFSHSLALKNDGTVWAWGNNGFGQLGDGTTTDRATPVQVKGPGGVGFLSSVTAIAGGYYYSLALKNDGTVWAWGNNYFGQLGDNSTLQKTTPVQVGTPGNYLTGITAIAGGGYHSLALKNDGTVWAWGNNYFGQLGDNSTLQKTTPVQVGTPGNYLTGITAIAGGSVHSLAVKNNDNVWAWGFNYRGQLGIGTQDSNPHPLPVQVSGLTGITAIAGGSHLSLAFKNNGTAWAWGYNGFGQLGDGTTTDRATPVQVKGPGGVGFLTGITAIAGGGYHSLALKSDGTVWAWGYNGYGQLGDNSTLQKTTPVQVGTPGNYLTGITAIAGGGYHSLALKNDGTVWAWGWNYYGQLGDGTTIDRNTPVQVLLPAAPPDANPPTTTISLNPSTPNGQNNWYTSNVNVTLSAIDDGGGSPSGVDKTYYKLTINGVPGTQTEYSAPFDITNEGNIDIEYWSVDKASPPNQETHKTAPLKIDKTNPAIVSTQITPGIVGTTATIDISKTVTDPAPDSGLSGVTADIKNSSGSTVGTISLSLVSGTWQGTYTFPGPGAAPDGEYTITDIATDNAGNLITEVDGSVILDRTAPTAIIVFITAYAKSYNPVEVKVSASDQTTGIASVLANYTSLNLISGSANPGQTGLWQGSITAAGAEGSHDAIVKVTDNAANTATLTPSYIVDNTPPSTIATLNPLPVNNWNNIDVTVTLEATDYPTGFASGVSKIGYKKEGAETTPGYVEIIGSSGSFTISAEGTTTVSFGATDNVGNMESPDKSVQVKIDKTSPVTTFTSSSVKTNYNSTTKVYIYNTTINLTATDNPGGSGVKEIHYQIETDPWVVVNSSSATFTKTHPTPFTVNYYAVDNVTNQETQKTKEIDATKMSVVVDGSQAATVCTADVCLTFPAGSLPAGFHTIELTRDIYPPNFQLQQAGTPVLVIEGYTFKVDGLSTYNFAFPVQGVWKFLSTELKNSTCNAFSPLKVLHYTSPIASTTNCTSGQIAFTTTSFSNFILAQEIGSEYNIEIEAVEHKLDYSTNKNNPISIKVPLTNTLVELYDMDDITSYLGTSAIQPDQYEEIRANVDYAYITRTDSQGKARFGVEETGKWLVLGLVGTEIIDDYILDMLPHFPVYVHLSARAEVTSSTSLTNPVRAKITLLTVPADAKSYAGKSTTVKGSGELEIIEPEAINVTSSTEFYPYVFNSSDDWVVEASVEPPEGWTADQANILLNIPPGSTDTAMFTLTAESAPTASILSIGKAYAKEGKGKAKGIVKYWLKDKPGRKFTHSNEIPAQGVPFQEGGLPGQRKGIISTVIDFIKGLF